MDFLKNLLCCCDDWGIVVLMVYVFFIENWGCFLEEVEFLMILFEWVLWWELKEMMVENVCICFVGNLIFLFCFF